MGFKLELAIFILWQADSFLRDSKNEIQGRGNGIEKKAGTAYLAGQWNPLHGTP